MLTQVKRFSIIIFVILLVSLLGYYAIITGPTTEVSTAEIVSQPEKYLDQELAFGGQIVEYTKNHTVVIKDRGTTIQVRNLEKGIPIGNVITGLATVEIDNGIPILNISEYHHHSGRNIKIISGPIVLGTLFIIFLTKYKLNLSNWTFEKKIETDNQS